VYQTKSVEKFKTHMSCSIDFFFRKSCRSLDNGSNILEPDRLQMTIWHMHIARWVLTATNTYSEYVILTVFHDDNGCTNASQCYVILTFLVLLMKLTFAELQIGLSASDSPS
jgi:hypothetical protein